MSMRPTRRLRHRARMASLVAALPLPAYAADATMQAWGAYLFFAIVATVVIVLLLHEALDDGIDEQRRDDKQNTLGSARAGGAARFATESDRTEREKRRMA